MRIHILLCITLISTLSSKVWAIELKPFTATYQISRGGKVTAQQTTRLTQISDTLWQIEDNIIGTKGMASLMGFKRTEITQFELTNEQIVATQHKMRQKVAFSKRNYNFIYDKSKSEYSGTYKDKPFTISTNQTKPVISSQLLPLAIAIEACNNQSEADFNVIKSNSSKTYHFRFEKNKQPTANRVYPPNSKKKTQSWLDQTKHCWPTKQLHSESDEPTIETTLIEFKWSNPQQ